jgi:hypothetical protein
VPDIYFTNFIEWMNLYTRQDNPLLIPETFGDPSNAFYAYGALDCICFSPFGIDSSLGRFGSAGDTGDSPLAMCYNVLKQLTPLILKYNGTDTMTGVLLEQNDSEKHIPMGDYVLDCFKSGRGSMLPNMNSPGPIATWAQQANQQSPQKARPPEAQLGARGRTGSFGSRAGAIIIALGPDEYLMAGSGLTVEFTPNKPGPSIGGISFIDEVTFVNGEMVIGRRLNGDQNSQGQRLRLRNPSKIYHVKAYRYR